MSTSMHELLLIPAWIGNHMPSKVWDESTYPFPNLKLCSRWSLEWINNLVSHVEIDAITLMLHLDKDLGAFYETSNPCTLTIFVGV